MYYTNILNSTDFDIDYLSKNLSSNFNVTIYNKSGSTVYIAAGYIQINSNFSDYNMVISAGSGYPANSIRLALYGVLK